MSLISSNVNNGFQFCWDIENIDMCFYAKRITSPTFVANNMNQTEWSLSLHPKKMKENTFIIALTRTDSGNDTGSISIDFAISVSTSDGIKKALNEKKKVEFLTGFTNSCYWAYRSRDILFEEDLTIYCHMKESNKETLPHIRCWARTVLGEEQRSGVWKIENFGHLPPGCKKKFFLCSTIKQAPKIEIAGALHRTTRIFHIELQVTHDKPIFIFGKISLLTAKGELKWPTIESFSFDNLTSSQTFKFPLKLKQETLAQFLISRPNDLLSQGALTFLCEFNISTGIQYSEIIESNYLTPKYRCLQHLEVSENETQNFQVETNDTQYISLNSGPNSSTPKPLKEDLKNFYTQIKLCDVTLHCENKTFPAHRTILCSRSSVFTAMFDHDMKESTNKKVDIVDMDADTLDSFLLFLYSETLDNLQWNRAIRLLNAANKYQVDSLKNECTSFLMSKLSLPNVCEALELADLYQDDQLRTKCQDFILANATEIFSSKEWEKFTVGNPVLSTKLLQRYFSQKK